MTDQDRLDVVHRWFTEVWNQGDETLIDQWLDPGCILYGVMDLEGNHVQGPKGFKPFFRRFRQAFPDIHIAVEDAMVKGEKVATRCYVTGTHSGDGLGIAPTGKRIEFTGMCITQIEEGPRVVHAWNNFDFLRLYQQIGLLPEI